MSEHVWGGSHESPTHGRSSKEEFCAAETHIAEQTRSELGTYGVPGTGAFLEQVLSQYRWVMDRQYGGRCGRGQLRLLIVFL